MLQLLKSPMQVLFLRTSGVAQINRIGAGELSQ